MPEIKSLNLVAFGELDGGKVNIAAQEAIRQCVNDINDRPAEKKPRVITLKVSLTPKLDSESGALDTVDVRAEIESRMPKKTTSKYPMLATEDGRLTFVPGSPNDPRQGSLFEGERQEQQADE